MVTGGRHVKHQPALLGRPDDPRVQQEQVRLPVSAERIEGYLPGKDGPRKGEREGREGAEDGLEQRERARGREKGGGGRRERSAPDGEAQGNTSFS